MHRICFLLLLSFSCLGQKAVSYRVPANGQITLSDGIEIPQVDAGYTIFLTENKAIGAVVFFHTELDTAISNSIINLARQRDLATLFVNTENSFEFLFEVKKMQELESYIYQACVNYDVPIDNLLFSGMSLEGTRALKMAIFSKSDDSQNHILPKAVAICDAPLDMVRFWAETDKAWRMNLNEVAANEGQWVSHYLTKNLGGKPAEVITNYINYSPFCYTAEYGGNARFLKDIAIRAYTEPDVMWWIENRGKDYYSMNSIDAAALINQIKIDGNEHAELILTEGKGIRPDGSRHPHSWSIVNEPELLNWFLGL
ncbi:hypothetical protein [uncultured Arcticibacterium sp.]|uniref:hypothetical protein n=1 Tax=uncultured Arcticibacterium sp. TaxID=2173042 RepID=UPI0030F91390